MAMVNPKIYILSADASGRIEGVMNQNILAHLPNRVHSMAEADIVLVPLSYYGDYRFNEELRNISKPWILMDFMEWFGFAETHLWGKEPLPENILGKEGWEPLNKWIEENPPALTFQRELKLIDKGDARVPIEWPRYLEMPPRVSKEEFDKRPFEVFFNWGYSHGSRPRFQGEAYRMMGEGRIDVISSFDHIDAKRNEPQRKWICIHTPHTHRVPIGKIMEVQQQAKCSVSLPGSGVKCFRSTECGIGAIPVTNENAMAWSFPWVDMQNCLNMTDRLLRLGYERLLFCEHFPELLYPIYLAAQDLMEKYGIQNYRDNYIMPHIRRVL